MISCARLHTAEKSAGSNGAGVTVAAELQQSVVSSAPAPLLPADGAVITNPLNLP